MGLQMTKSTSLDQLNNQLFNGQSELNQVFNLCSVMEICGGYQQLVNLPLPALNMIIKYLENVNKQANKGMPKKGRR